MALTLEASAIVAQLLNTAVSRPNKLNVYGNQSHLMQ